MAMSRFHLIFLISFLGLFSCSNDPIAPGTTTSIELSNFPNLPSGYCYRLWFNYPTEIIKNNGGYGLPQNGLNKGLHGNNEYKSICRFTSLDNKISFLDGKQNADVPSGINPNLFADAIITVETLGDSMNTEPTLRVLSGNFTGDEQKATSALTLYGDDAFTLKIKTDLQDSLKNKYFLDSPTSKDLSDFASGIWFANFEPNNITQGLFLTPLPHSTLNNRWIYEAWLSHDSNNRQEYISLGRFKTFDTSDYTKAGEFAGDLLNEAYKFPGEDFVKQGNKRVLTDGTYKVIISLQPFDYDFNFPFLPIQLSNGIIANNISRGSPNTLIGNNNPPMAVVKINRWVVK